MVVVRESPRAKLSPDKDPTQWPPKSPFQALMSSPSGRKKWKDYSRRDDRGSRSPSPSPARRNVTSSAALRALSVPSDEEDEDDEDEEMMKLKLQEIQAKLKLKEMQRQKRKAKLESAENTPDIESRTTSRAESMMSGSPRRFQRPPSEPRKWESNIEVPLSPSRDRLTVAKEQLSPARVRLGLSSAAKAHEVSLKRARGAGMRMHSEMQSNDRASDSPQPRSFSERLAASRVEASNQLAKQERIAQSRSQGFGSIGTTFSQTKTLIQKSSRPELTKGNLESIRSPPIVTQRSTLINRDTGGRSSAFASGSNTPRPGSAKVENKFQSAGSEELSSVQSNEAPAQKSDENSSPSSYDPFSEIHLSKRHIPHIDVARGMESCEIYTLPRLLKEVKAPHYDPPDCEGDYVVFAVLASKSSPYDQKARNLTSDSDKQPEDAHAPRNKFMVLKLCDFKWEVDCFLFGTAFDQFWKLTPGTLLAILNPGIMPPKTNQHNGRFTLKLGSSEDSVMEIGVARDLGYCVSMKKDGNLCGEWVDKRKTEICEFHLNLLVEKQRKGRMEVNTMWRGAVNSDNKPNSMARGKGGWDKKTSNSKAHGEYGRLYTVPSGFPGKSAASLLDDDDVDKMHNMTREEASRKRIATAQRERDLARRLGEMGNGVGAEYLRASVSGSTDSGVTPSTPSTVNFGSTDGGATAKSSGQYFEKPKIGDLGLLGNKADAIRLSPAKDRKRHFGLGTLTKGTGTTGGGREAMGWGGARKAGLWGPPSQPPPPPPSQTKQSTPRSALQPTRAGIVRERSQDELSAGGTVRSGSQSPRKKRARFALSQGVREPGRESLGVPLNDIDDDDDDGLDIIA